MGRSLRGTIVLSFFSLLLCAALGAGSLSAQTLSVSDASGSEGGNLTFTVTLSASPSAAVEVDYATSVGGSDTASSSDFTSTSGSVSFASGASGSDLMQTFTVAATQDPLAEGAETFTVTISGTLPSGVTFSDSTGTGTISASDAATLSVNDASAAEGSNMTFTVSLSGSPGAAVTVDYATSVGGSDTASSSDFTAKSGSVTFAAGATGGGLSRTFTVATTQDSLAEGAETFTVTLTAPSGGFPGGVSINDGTGRGTINASDAATLSVGDATGSEGGNLTFTVTLSRSPGAAVTVDFATSVASGDTAVQADFTAKSGSVTFAAGATGGGLSKSFTVAAADDSLAEGAETFTVTLSAPSGGFPGGISINDGTGRGTIRASDAATLSVGDASGAEGGNVTFTVSLSKSPGAAVTVDFATSVATGDTAVQSDFTAKSGSVTFAAGATGSGLMKSFTVAAADDSLAEGAETFTVTLSAPSGGFPGGISINDGTGRGTINASDAASLSINDASADEGSNVSFTVSLSGSPAAAVTVNFATSVASGDTAVQADFTSRSGSVTFAAGATGGGLSKTVTVSTTDDTRAEGAETFTVTLTAPAAGLPGGVSISDATGKGTIKASDEATLSINDASAAEGSNVMFTVSLSGSPGAAVTVNFATSVATGDTAVQSDFTAKNGSVTFAAGATGAGLSKTFTVATTQDSLAEGAERFTVTLSAPGSGFPGGISINDGTGKGTINASDAATLSINDASAAEGSNVMFTVSLSGSPGAAVTVNFATSVATGDTAVQSDFTAKSGSVTFAAGATGAGLSKTFTVATTQDSLAEGAERFTVTLSAPGSGFPGGISINDGTGRGTINASDAATLKVNDASAAEGSNVTFTVTLSGSPGAAVTVDFATSVAATDTAVQSDFTSTTGSVTFASGATGNGLTKTFTVATTQDSLAEGAETFTVRLSAPSGGFPGGISINDGTGKGTINLSDPATLKVNDSSAAEGSNVTFTVTLSGSPGAAVTVDFATSVATGNTAVQSDFTSTTGSVTFASGATGNGLTKTFTVATTQDALAEGAETFTVSLSAPSGGFPGAISINDGTGTGTINLSDPATLSVNSASAAEGSNVTFTVTLSGSPGAAVTVDFATSVATGNTAVQSDFTNTTGSVTFAAGATGNGLRKMFTVATVNDALAEGNETFTVTLSAPSGGFPGGISLNTSATAGTGTINLSDAATLSVNDPRGGEGADLTFAVTLSGSPGAAVTVDYATSIATGDTAIQSDFTSTTGTLTFAAEATGGALTQTFTVALTDDMLVEGDETFTVTLSEPSGKFPPAISISDATGTGTIGAKGSASLDVTSTSAAEGANLTFTVTLSASPGNPVTVDYATSVGSGDTAIQSDFTSTSGTLTFATAATGMGLVKTFEVAAADDALAEGAETFTVTLSEPSTNFPAGISIGTGTGEGTISLSDPASLSVSDASGVEGGNVTFTVTLSGSPGNRVTVDFATGIRSGDTAVQSDITSTTGSVSFAVGATGGGLTRTFTVAATDDELAEGEETFSVTLSEPSSSFPAAISLGDSIGQGTINANDPATLSVSDASGGEGGNLTFTVTLSGSPAVAVTVDYATSSEQGDTAGTSDYTSASGSLTFEAEATGGALSQPFTVAATADDLVEGAEMFTVTLSEPPAGFPPSISIGGPTGKGTITASGSAILSVSEATRSEGGDLTFTVTLSASPASAVTVDYATSIEADDTASESDFESTSGSLTFEAESTGAALSQTFTVAALRDPLIEGPETFTVSLLRPPGGFPAGVGISRRGGTAKGTITSPGSAVLSVSDASAAEGGDLTFTVTLSDSPASAVTVDYATSVGPDDTASESDFESVSGSLTFEAEATGDALSRTFTVAAATDSLEEGDETFTVTLSSPSAGFPPRVSIGDATGTGTIAGTGGSGGPGGATLSVSDVEGTEGDDLTFTVTLSGTTAAAVTLDYATGIGPDDTASASDFESVSGSLTFAAGATGDALAQTFTVATVADDVVEGDETFTVTLSAPSAGLPAGVRIADATGTGTIADAATPNGRAELSVSDASGDEGSDLTFTVTLSASPAAAVTVDYATGIGSGDTASESDFESVSGSLTFSAGATGEALSRTFAVAAVRDELVEGDETFTVTLSAPSAGLPAGVRIADATGTGTIADATTPVVQAELSVSDASGDEGGDLTFTVTLSASPAAAVAVEWATSIGSGDTASPSDFESAGAGLVFAAGATGAALSRTFTVAAVADDLVEGDETFTVTLSAASTGFPPGISISDATGTGTIIGAGSAELSVSDASGAEGGDLTFTVTLSARPGARVRVSYATRIESGDTATPSDFTGVSGSLTFAAGASGAALSQNLQRGRNGRRPG